MGDHPPEVNAPKTNTPEGHTTEVHTPKVHTPDTHTPEAHINTDAKTADDGVKRMPHERDESPDGKDRAPRGIMQQAAADLSQGLVDTDLHATPGAAPAAGPAGQATPQPDAANGMRDHHTTTTTTTTTPSTKKPQR